MKVSQSNLKRGHPTTKYLIKIPSWYTGVWISYNCYSQDDQVSFKSCNDCICNDTCIQSFCDAFLSILLIEIDYNNIIRMLNK